MGAGPTGIYTFFSLLKSKTPLSIFIYEREEKAGVGMPYNDKKNSKMMLANITSTEIPPIITTCEKWLKNQKEKKLASYGVDKSALHEEQFVPRVLLGKYFRTQFLALVKLARARGFKVVVHESCKITDLEVTRKGVKLWAEGKPVKSFFDLAIISTGHAWPEKKEMQQTYFPSPWSGLHTAKIPDCEVGIIGTSLSAIDAAMIVAAQHGNFVRDDDEQLCYILNQRSKSLSITLMSRMGILPEADFYCPMPYEPLAIATEHAIKKEIAAGSNGLLDRVFALLSREIKKADPSWSKQISLDTLNADSFSAAYFAERKRHNPFLWAQDNLKEAEQNKHNLRTVPWRYTILRLHEVVEQIVPYLDDVDRGRFTAGLRRVFVDNYAVIPSESVRRLIALYKAGIISILTLGQDYCMEVEEDHTVIMLNNKRHVFKIFVDARGQKPLKIPDMPFPRLRRQLQGSKEYISDISDNYMLTQPEIVHGRIAFAALPYLMHDYPFIQGIEVSANIGSVIAKAVTQQT